MNILFAAGHLPSLCAAQAGGKTSYALARSFAMSDRVHLLAFATQNEIARSCEAEMKMYASSRIYPVTKQTRALGILGAPHLPLAIAARSSRRYQREFMNTIAREVIDAVVFDHTAMMQYAHLVPTGVVTVAILHDILIQSWERKILQADGLLARTAVSLEAGRVRRWERHTFQRIDLLSPLNRKDQLLIESMAETRHPVTSVQPWIEAPTPDKGAERRCVRQNSLLFWGAMDRLENRDAVTWAATEIMPRIQSAVPGAHLYIAGSKSESLRAVFANRSDISILGFVDNVEAMMSEMQVALLPLRLGAGIKVKTLECMAAAVPVVTTKVGIEGIDATQDVDFLAGEDAKALAEQAIVLLQQPEKAMAIGNSGREFLRTWYDFDGKARALREELRLLVEG